MDDIIEIRNKKKTLKNCNNLLAWHFRLKMLPRFEYFVNHFFRFYLELVGIVGGSPWSILACFMKF